MPATSTALTTDWKAANVVTVFDVVSDGRGIVVIREGGAVTGAVLGWAAVDGDDGDVEITLSRPAIHRETLWAGLYQDNDVTEEWDEATDGPIQVNPLDGVEQSGSFEVRYPPAVVAEDQTASPPNGIVVASALSTVGGFVVVFGEGEPAPIGQAIVTSGPNKNIAVTLDRDVTNGETLTATLFADTDNSGTLDIALDQSEDASDTFIVYLTVTPDVTATDTSATSLTSRVAVDSATSDGPGWLVLFEDAAGVPGAVIGQTALTAGTATGVEITADRPLVDGETLHVAVHSDASPVATWDPATDIVQQDAGADVTGTFVVTVGADLPDGRILFSNTGSMSYNVYEQEPAWLDAIGGGGENQAVTLTAGLRYAFFNEAAGAHPLALLDGSDQILLSPDGDGSLEADADVNYVEDGATMTFTAAPSLVAAISRYVCTIHPAMTGSMPTQ